MVLLRNFSAIKEKIRTKSHSKNLLVRWTVLLIRFCYNCVMAFASPDRRTILLLKLFRSKNLHQTTSLTALNRYPGIFSACRQQLGDRHALNILSFGCATGEEVMTLRKYFPTARIIGAEINTRSLSICSRLQMDNLISFVFSNPNTLKRHGPFDAIFCMAVLQRTPHLVKDQGITDLKRIYPFEKFEQQVMEFDSLLKKNGLLVIHNTQYRFLDTSCANKYGPLEGGEEKAWYGSVFDKHSKRIEDISPQSSIFLKIRD